MASAQPAITSQRQVTYLACRTDAREHERATQRGVAARLAAMMGCRFDEVRHVATSGPVDLGYVVPDMTIASLDTARALGIRGEEDLFGGVVPFPFVATKTITHPLIDPAAAAPQGWQSDFPERVRDVTLPGWSAFSLSDARAAGRRLLQGGDVRVKLASGIGGAGQSVARSEAELDAQLAAIGPAEFAEGVVVERNLVDVRTYSVGRVRVGPCWSATSARSAPRAAATARRSTAAPPSRWRGATSRRSIGSPSKTERDARSEAHVRITTRHWRASPACSRHDATTTSPRDATQAVGDGSASSSSRGESAAPAARRWQRSRP